MSTRCTTFAPSSTWETRSVCFYPPLLSAVSASSSKLPLQPPPHPPLCSTTFLLPRRISVLPLCSPSPARHLPPLFFAVSSFHVTSLPGQNINDQANHPKRTRANPRHEGRGGEACNCRELAKCRIGGGSAGERVHGTGDAFLVCVGLRRGRRNGLTVFVDDPSPTSTPRNRDAACVFRMFGRCWGHVERKRSALRGKDFFVE